MTEELILIKLLFSKEYYTKYYHVISKIELDSAIKLILSVFTRYYEEYASCEALTPSEFLVFFDYLYPSSKHRNTVENIVTKAYSEDINKELSNTILRKFIEKYYALALVDKLTPALEGWQPGLMEEAQRVIAQFNDVSKEFVSEEQLFCEDDVATLAAKVQTTDGLRWRLKCLDSTLGPMSGGVLGHVYARSDSGKTSFGISEAAFMASQLADGQRIVYAGNEEAIARLRWRSYCAVLKCTRQELMSWLNQGLKDKIEERFVKYGGHRLMFTDYAKHISQLRTVIDRTRPKLLFVDQGPKVLVAGHDKLKEHSRLELVYSTLRDLAKEFDVPVVTLGQADGASDGRKWLGLDAMYASKVGIPGELDFAIGIGRVYEAGMENTRFVYVCKNKLLDGDNIQAAVQFDRHRCIYTD